MAEAYYTYYYQLTAAGDRVRTPTAWTDIHFAGEVMVGEVSQVFYAFDDLEQDAFLYYQGADAGGNPYFTTDAEGDVEKIYLSDTPYHWNDRVPPYDERHTSAFAASFLTGTRIATPKGDAAIETLAPGDLVLTADGRATPVKWLGRQSVAVASGGDEAPIHVAAGALGLNLPARDLKLTADHALLIDGVFIQASVLVNGVTIRRMTRAETGDRYTVWHIETEGHDVILTEGCLTETFVDSLSRRRFDNYAEYEAKFGAEGGKGGVACGLDLPRIRSTRQLPASVRSRIAIRRAEIGRAVV